MSLLPKLQLNHIAQKRRKQRQASVLGPVVYVEVGALASNTAGSTVPSPNVTIVPFGAKYKSLTWQSSDPAVIDFDLTATPAKFKLGVKGQADITATITNLDGSTRTITQRYEVA